MNIHIHTSGIRGAFAIFAPGIFLLLNLATFIYLFPFTHDVMKDIVVTGVSYPVLSSLSIFIFGYLIGIVLRLITVDLVDRWSARWLRRFNRGDRQKDGHFKLYVSEEFPYIGWIEEACKLYLPPETLNFYNSAWGNRRRGGGGNKRFLNYCKNLINSVDEKSTNEIYAAEALSRYIAGMFYAMLFAFCLILLAGILHYIFFGEKFDATIKFLAMVLFVYSLIIVRILSRFRFIRIKEVEAVFDATFRNRSIIGKDLGLAGNSK